MRESALPSPLRDVLDSVGRRLGLGPNAVDSARLWSRWGAIVGDTVARHAEPTSLRDGVLRVRVDSPAWATEVAYLASEIQRRANSVLGGAGIREVRVWMAPGPIRAQPARRATPGAAPRSGPPADPSADPRAAFERAREAWAKRRAEGG